MQLSSGHAVECKAGAASSAKRSTRPDPSGVKIRHTYSSTTTTSKLPILTDTILQQESKASEATDVGLE